MADPDFVVTVPLEAAEEETVPEAYEVTIELVGKRVKEVYGVVSTDVAEVVFTG